MTIPQASLVFSILAIANGAAFAGEAYIKQPVRTEPQKAVANANLEKMLASPIKLNDVKIGVESHPRMNGNTSYVSQNGSQIWLSSRRTAVAMSRSSRSRAP